MRRILIGVWILAWFVENYLDMQLNRKKWALYRSLKHPYRLMFKNGILHSRFMRWN
jgi:hypothetical protein